MEQAKKKPYQAKKTLRGAVAERTIPSRLNSSANGKSQAEQNSRAAVRVSQTQHIFISPFSSLWNRRLASSWVQYTDVISNFSQIMFSPSVISVFLLLEESGEVKTQEYVKSLLKIWHCLKMYSPQITIKRINEQSLSHVQFLCPQKMGWSHMIWVLDLWLLWCCNLEPLLPQNRRTVSGFSIKPLLTTKPEFLNARMPPPKKNSFNKSKTADVAALQSVQREE